MPPTKPMHPFWRGMLDLLYPPRCEACGRLRREPICGECSAAIERIRPPVCEVCGEPFDPRAQTAPKCADCRGRRRPFSVARSAAYYEGPLAAAIRRFKYHSQLVLGKPLGGLMADALGDGPAADLHAETIEVVCAVPLHESRLRERGFNQSRELGEVVAGAIGKPLLPLLERTRPTLPQVDLPAESRRANVQGAFEANLREVIAKQRVLLIDDLFTTGATMAECARVLRRAGAEEVRVFTLARPVPQWRRAGADARALAREQWVD
ncbi:MAG: ComF family protein [Armatimonadota bacterium]|nr:MAG: ComF family protein [Armatimonadota bacterium]